MKLSAGPSKLKAEARKKAKELGIPLARSLDAIARREGYASWSLLARRIREAEEAALKNEMPAEITSLPLTGLLRKEAIRIAEASFARALGRMEARNPRSARRSWDAGDYVDRTLTPDMLPIETNYALHLIEVFLVMEAADAASDADEEEA